MKIIIIYLIAIFIIPVSTFCNNIVLSSLSLTDQINGNQTVNIKFDISWENSWRTSTAPNNWDAAWIFVKYKKASDDNWYHATLSSVSSNHSTGSVGLGGTVYARNDGKGVFLYRSNDGIGSFSSDDVKLNWHYGIDGIGNNISNEITEYRVFAIEMVYVPQGSFYVGSGGSETNRFYTYGGNNPFNISSEDPIIVGTANGNLYYNTGVYSGDGLGPIPLAFPKGFNSFYCMKYEISQEQYVDFLNTLTREQQNLRTGTNLSAGTSSVANRYVMSNSSTMLFRNGIRSDELIHPSNRIEFYCDFNGNGIPNEPNDGQNIACNYLSWADGIAYADWAGLRPITELEFEKACRGPLTPVANEFAWGTSTIANIAYTLNNIGSANEGIATNFSTSAGNVSYSATDGSIDGPLRVGIFAAHNNNSGRVSSGASYYGIMELSGNAMERVVTIGNSIGRNFTGAVGDGALSSDGNSNVPFTPDATANGSAFRGGDWFTNVNYSRVSDRTIGGSAITTRLSLYGFRCVTGIVVP